MPPEDETVGIQIHSVEIQPMDVPVGAIFYQARRGPFEFDVSGPAVPLPRGPRFPILEPESIAQRNAREDQELFDRLDALGSDPTFLKELPEPREVVPYGPYLTLWQRILRDDLELDHAAP